MILKLVTAPTTEPVSPADVCSQIRVEPQYLADSDDYIAGLIAAVREKAENVCRRSLITQTWEMVLDRFPSGRTAITIPLPPLQSVTSVKYLDTDGVERTLNPLTYRVDTDSQPARIIPVVGTNWPDTIEDIATVRIRFVCGYGASASDVPASIRQWMLINIANLYENRETLMISNRAGSVDIETLADSLLASHRVYGW